MPNHPMPPPYPICEAHAARLAGLEQRTDEARLQKSINKLRQLHADARGVVLHPRTQSAKPVAHVFPGRKPDLNHELDRVYARMWRLEEYIREVSDYADEWLKEMDVTYRQRMADLWCRIDALTERMKEQAADLAETREALKAAQKRLREMDEDSHGERG